jgi:arylsulfatase A-like enzyme
MDWQLPVNRGFNASFGFLGGGEDHITQAGMPMEWGCAGTDLWQSHGPATGMNGTYSGYLYNDAAVRVIEQHPDPDTHPLFIYLALQTMHAPLEAPSCFSDLYPESKYTHTYAVSNGMATVSDSVLANVTAALKKRGMWERTLIVHLSDNGGPVAAGCGSSHANNYPLRGGKHSNWEGGIRVVAFASGGFLPASRHGTVLRGITHNADWYPTLATLAGASPDDPPAPGVTDVPGVDGYATP